MIFGVVFAFVLFKFKFLCFSASTLSFVSTCKSIDGQPFILPLLGSNNILSRIETVSERRRSFQICFENNQFKWRLKS